MSIVISIRLNPNNPRDAKALAVIQDWLSQGLSTRHTITEALLNLDTTQNKSVDNEALKDLSQQIRILLENIQSDVTIDKVKDKMLSQKYFQLVF